MSNENPQVAGLLRQLAEQNLDYICSATLPDTVVTLRFPGPFQNRTVIWDTTITTIQHYYQNRHQEAGKPFIEIKEDTDSIYKLTVGLNLPTIDVPTIKKTIIMIRNYKRLSIGCHEWGEAVPIIRSEISIP